VWLVVGLGNPGRRYARTRHNVGFRVVDRLAARWGVSVEREVHRALVGEVRRSDQRIMLVKPQTFMNASGEAAASLQRFYRVGAGEVIAVHDDVDLEVGRVRVRRGGRGGGNRGVDSLITTLGDGFVRVKVGVGRPPAGPVAADYVLAVPAPEEAARLERAEGLAADAVELVLSDGLDRAMNRINQREAMHGGSPL
jgi:peptidyl-tRNA hydrolase, PTH1 family